VIVSPDQLPLLTLSVCPCSGVPERVGCELDFGAAFVVVVVVVVVVPVVVVVVATRLANAEPPKASVEVRPTAASSTVSTALRP
jgi:hypothetical protein